MMKMLLMVELPNAPFNALVRSGKIGEIMGVRSDRYGVVYTPQILLCLGTIKSRRAIGDRPRY